jgi:hypothetical protein
MDLWRCAVMAHDVQTFAANRPKLQNNACLRLPGTTLQKSLVQTISAPYKRPPAWAQAL